MVSESHHPNNFTAQLSYPHVIAFIWHVPLLDIPHVSFLAVINDLVTSNMQINVENCQQIRIKMMNTNTTKIHVDHNTAASNVKTAAKPIYLDNFDQNVTTARSFTKSWNPSTKIWTHCFWSEWWKERMVSLSLTSLQHVVPSCLASEETILFWLA